MTVSRDKLKDLVDQAVSAADAPHIDLGPMLGTSMPVRIGLDDMHALLQSEEPSFKLEVSETTLTVRRQDGGMMATLELKW